MEALIGLIVIYGGIILIGAIIGFIGEQHQKAKIKILKYKIAEKYQSLKSLASFDVYSEMIALKDLTKQIAPEGLPVMGAYNKYQYGHLNYELKSVDTHKYCPDCHSKLLIRVNGKTGTKFLGCSRYPLCTHTEGYSNG